jgi:hypothetical protein
MFKPTDAQAREIALGLQSEGLRELLWRNLSVLPPSCLPQRLSQHDFKADMFQSIVSEQAEPESLCHAAPSALFPITRGGVAVASNLILLHQATAQHRASLIFNAIICDKVDGKPYFLKSSSNRRKTKIAPLRTGLSADKVKVLWGFVTSHAAADKDPGELDACARSVRVWSCLRKNDHAATCCITVQPVLCVYAYHVLGGLASHACRSDTCKVFKCLHWMEVWIMEPAMHTCWRARVPSVTLSFFLLLGPWCGVVRRACHAGT